MNKILNKYTSISIVISIFLIVLGILLMTFTDTSITVFGYSLAMFLIVQGVYFVVLDIYDEMYFIPFGLLPKGVLSIILGAILFAYPKTLVVLIPVITGVWFITTSAINLRVSYMLKDISKSSWILTLVISILSIICGICLIARPIMSARIVIMTVGMVLVVYAISNIIDMITFRQHMNELIKTFKKQILNIKDV